MATLQLEVNEPLVQLYTNATDEQKQHVARVMANVLMLLSNNTTKQVKNLPLNDAFKPFNAIQMKGKGPTALEMVIQDRRNR